MGRVEGSGTARRGIPCYRSACSMLALAMGNGEYAASRFEEWTRTAWKCPNAKSRASCKLPEYS